MSEEVKETIGEDNKKIRKVFLDDLPRKEGIGKNKNKQVIDWTSSIGYKVKGIYEGTKFEVEISNYKDGYLYIKYLDRELFKIFASNFKSCRLGKLLSKITNEFKIEIDIIKDNNRDIIILDKKIIKKEYLYQNYNTKWYKCICNKCGNKYWIDEGNLLKGTGCGVCCSAPKFVKEGFNDIPTTEPWMIPYFQGGYDEAKLYTKSSDKKIYPKCPECGRIKDKPMTISNIHRTHSIACICSDKISYPNKFSHSLLEQLNKIYKFEYLKHEYSPEWVSRKSYDNYFIYNGKEYILEMDGKWHKIDNNLSGQTKEESKAIDDYKDKMAKEHGIEVIRIDCEKSELEFIKQNIINSKLNEIFDLSNIDWLEIEKYTLSNLVKVACGYKVNNPDLTTTQIGNIMKLNRSTVLKYLKKGSKLNWCI